MSVRFLVLANLVQALFIGGLFLFYPRIARRGLLFGVYVGETASLGEPARRLTQAYQRWVGGVIAVILAAGLALLALPRLHPVALVGPILLQVVGCIAVYLWVHRQARSLAATGLPEATATLEVTPPSRSVLAPFTLVVSLVTGLAVLGWAWSLYPLLPDRVPTHFGITGAPDAWGRRSLASVLLLPLLTLVVGVGLGGMAWLMAGAKRSLRAGDQGVSLEAQLASRRATSRFLSGVALITVAMMAVLSVGSLRVASGQARGLAPAGMILVGVLVLYALGGTVYLAARYGQGGSRLERRAASAPLTDGLADNRCWVWGIFYVNREDPSWLVENRFGLGYTVNLGNPKAAVAFGTFLALLLGLPLLALLLS